MRTAKRLFWAAAATLGIAVAAAGPAIAGVNLSNHSERLLGPVQSR